ncbi:hypothetical protein BDR07DRAFT_1382721 [Suillus spraguei]|nr:hypothetical protein BDR07DRAFT_1382721 [Suillus spraguei]
MLQIDEEIPRHIALLDDELLDDIEEDFAALPLLKDHQDLPYHEERNGACYMGGVGGGLGLGVEHLRQLESLTRDDKPEIMLASIDENVVGLDHAGLVVWEFSDGNDSESDEPDEW